MPFDRPTLRTHLLAHVRSAAGDPPPPIVEDYDVGTSGAVADLVVAADEMIAFAIHLGGEPPEALRERLAICARYFDRVVLATSTDDLPELATVERAGAALWAVGADGKPTEHRAGVANRVSPAALFDLMSPDQRARLLRPAIRLGFDRDRPPVAPALVREHARAAVAAPALREWRVV